MGCKNRGKNQIICLYGCIYPSCMFTLKLEEEGDEINAHPEKLEQNEEQKKEPKIR